MSGPVQLRIEEGIAECCLQHPPCNEIGVALVDALGAALDQVAASAARVLLVYSDQPGFCAGADLRGLYAAIEGREPVEYMPELEAMLSRIHGLMNRLDLLPMPTVAFVHGVCFGGGFELALACDVRIATRDARFCFPESRLGLIPGFGGLPRLQREQIPLGVISDLIYSGRSLSAKRAAELGLVAQVVGSEGGLQVARDCVRQMALFAPEVLATAKGFVKTLPKEALQREQALFLELFRQPRVVAALADFVQRSDALPYQPRAQPRDTEARS